MRALYVITLLLATSCVEPIPEDVCDEASFALDACGLSLPLMHDGPCAGLRREVGACIIENLSSCQDTQALESLGELCLFELLEEDELNVEQERDELCTDLVDNDGDGLVDADDPSCDDQELAP